MNFVRNHRGFTLIELVVTLALVGLVAYVSVPLYEVTSTRMREAELRSALREIRTAIDAYKVAADTGVIQKGATDTGYPPSLKVLVDGVESQRDAKGQRVMFLRHVPRDPFGTDSSAAPADQWVTRSYGSPPDEPQSGDDVYDVATRSTRVGLNGVPYKDW